MTSTYSPAAKKLLPLTFISLVLAIICLLIEPIFNKITDGTQIIADYESLFFLLASGYFAVQLIPGFARLVIDAEGYREIWFFRQRIRVKWMDIDREKCQFDLNGDTLYLNNNNEQLFSRKVAVKGTYTSSIRDIYKQFLEFSDTVQPSHPAFYFSLRKIRRIFVITFVIVFIIVNGFYLTLEQNNMAFKQQFKSWQEQHYSSEQLFDELKKQGLGWKKELKQLDRSLYFQILKVESSRIEALMLKYFKHNNQPSAAVLEHFKQEMIECRERYLFKDENAYLLCLNKL